MLYFFLLTKTFLLDVILIRSTHYFLVFPVLNHAIVLFEKVIVLLEVEYVWYGIGDKVSHDVLDCKVI